MLSGAIVSQERASEARFKEPTSPIPSDSRQGDRRAWLQLPPYAMKHGVVSAPERVGEELLSALFGATAMSILVNLTPIEEARLFIVATLIGMGQEQLVKKLVCELLISDPNTKKDQVLATLHQR